jgi:ABC-2 type transport system ATP-binding protein
VAGADRIVMIKAGEVIDNGTPAELIARTGAADLTEAYIALAGHPEATGDNGA